MKILVTVKRVEDYEAKLKLQSDGSDVIRENVNMIMNPFDQIAVEEALRIREKLGDNIEIVIASIGDAQSESQIRAAMAMGADRGVLVEGNFSLSEKNDALYIAKILKAIYEQEKPQIILMGKQSIDTDNHQTAEMLAEILNLPQATQANTVTIDGEKAIVVREADGGLETVACKFPCIITADLRLNEPRYAPLPGIMKAKTKPLAKMTVKELNINHSPCIKISKLIMPPARKSGQIVADIPSLVQKLKEEAKVL